MEWRLYLEFPLKPATMIFFKPSNLSKSPVKVTGISVKRQRDSSAGELVFSKRSREEEISDYSANLFSQVSTIQGMNINELVNTKIKVKVIEVGDIDEVQKDGELLKFQSVALADNSGSTAVSLCQNKVGHLEYPQSYQMFNMSIRRYKDEKVLSFTDDSLVNMISDTGKINNMNRIGCGQLENTVLKSFVGQLIACSNITMFCSCLFCGGRLKETGNDTTV